MFPCSGCGLCCQNITGVEGLEKFDTGTGICEHFNISNNSCSIYDNRPDICNIDKMYKLKYNQFFTKHEFYYENARVCNLLQERYKLDDSFKIILGD